MRKEGRILAKSVVISTKENAAKIVVDGNEISDIISYNLFEDRSRRALTLEIAVTDTIEVQMQ